MDTLLHSETNVTTTAELAERRRHSRVSAMWMGTLKARHNFFDCMVIDISAGGAKLAFAEPVSLGVGAAVTLILDRFGNFRGETAWQRGALVGVRFLDPPDAVAEAFGPILKSAA